MRPSSSTWRSSSSCLVLILSLAAGATAHARICLPPVFESGRRLVFAGVDVGGMNLLLRQHEVCWRSPASGSEQRVFVFGNSGIFGFPHLADETATEILNRRFERTGVPAHLFNLGFVLSYTLKDVLILREALRYEPDAIVFSVQLNDLVHVAPLNYPALKKLFDENSREIERFASEEPAGVAEPFARWRDSQADGARRIAAWHTLRDAGSLVRIAARNWAQNVRQEWFPDMPPVRPGPIGPGRKYKCEEVKQQFSRAQTDWHEWNPLAYLEQVRDQTGMAVLVVNWPAAHDPRGECFNRRYTTRAFEAYLRWIAVQARTRGFGFVDLQPDFPEDEFVDSVHTTAAGQAAVARLLEPHLRELLAVHTP